MILDFKFTLGFLKLFLSNHVQLVVFVWLFDLIRILVTAHDAGEYWR